MDVHSCSLYCSLSPFYPERNVQIGDEKDLPICVHHVLLSVLCVTLCSPTGSRLD